MPDVFAVGGQRVDGDAARTEREGVHRHLLGGGRHREAGAVSSPSASGSGGVGYDEHSAAMGHCDPDAAVGGVARVVNVPSGPVFDLHVRVYVAEEDS
ncbi:MAG: hypothetical protein CMM02_08040 [Rhodopirellula sp.]|nr:hypothetical protein [Rhodopirellula sp.]MAT10944.1 hypothetical protein [Rhodopirellula sp.]